MTLSIMLKAGARDKIRIITEFLAKFYEIVRSNNPRMIIGRIRMHEHVGKSQSGKFLCLLISVVQVLKKFIADV